MRPRAAGILIAAAAVVLATHLGSALAPRPAPDPALPPAAALTDPSGIAHASIDTIDRSIGAWTQNLIANPRDFLAATNLAVLYHGRGRLSGDLADTDRALEAAATALHIAPGHAPARAAEAAIRFTLHDFVGARGVAEALVRDDPTQLGALATLADAKLELGRLAGARADYERLAAATGGPAVDVRLARLAYVSGDPDGAVAHARAAYDAAARAGASDASFYAYALGEYARLTGDVVVARGGFEAALATRPDDLGALVGLARIDAFDGRLDAAIAGLRRAAAIAPQPETLALLGDLLAGRGDEAGARLQYDTVRLTSELSALAGAVYDRQLSLFALDHGGATEAILASARAALDVRADAGGHDLVAWAAYRLGRLDEARRASESALATGTRDARILFHAGAIARAAGDADRGRELLREAIALGPALDPLERAEAERLLAAH